MRSRRVIVAIVATAFVVLAACSGESAEPTSTAPNSTAPSTTVEAVTIVPPQLDGFDIDQVVVGDRLMLLAIADDPTLRQQGLMGVTDLADLDGMLFYWRHAADGGFWMKDTLIPLDIVWFDEGGAFVGRASMTPCTTEPCTVYSPGEDVDFRYAIEARPGDLDWIDGSTVIVHTD